MKQRVTAKISEMDEPFTFTDVMVKGAFHSFTHIHTFIEIDNGTIMKDHFEYQSPFGIIGLLADKLFLEMYMTQFLVTRANELKKMAEKETIQIQQ